MTDKPKRGRPPLPAERRGVAVTCWLEAKDYDRLYQRAKATRSSLSATLRREITTRRPDGEPRDR